MDIETFRPDFKCSDITNMMKQYMFGTNPTDLGTKFQGPSITATPQFTKHHNFYFDKLIMNKCNISFDRCLTVRGRHPLWEQYCDDYLECFPSQPSDVKGEYKHVLLITFENNTQYNRFRNIVRLRETDPSYYGKNPLCHSY